VPYASTSVAIVVNEISMAMRDIRDWFECCLVLGLTAFSHFWAALFPVLTGVSVVCGAVIGVHRVYKLFFGKSKPEMGID
jgi:hypothetical protein